ncbi:MAG: hypothetical protein ACR2L2_05400 [Acidobacteriota bacterium]
MSKRITTLALVLLMGLLSLYCSRGTESQTADNRQPEQAQPVAPAVSEAEARQQREAELAQREAEVARREAELTGRKSATQPRRAAAPAVRRETPVDPAPVRDAPRSDNRSPERVADRQPPRPVVRETVVRAGNELHVRLADTLDSRQSRAGERFSAILDRDLVVDGNVIARRGSAVEGRVVDVTDSGRVKGRSEIAFTLTSLNAGGRSYPIDTNTIRMQAEAGIKEDAAIIGGATGIGAAVGAVAKGKKGAAIGAAIGAGAGTAAVLRQKGKYIEIRPETDFTFRLQDDLVVRR